MFFHIYYIGEKRFQCLECTKKCMRSYHLTKHIKTHTKIRSIVNNAYSCDANNKVLLNKYNMPYLILGGCYVDPGRVVRQSSTEHKIIIALHKETDQSDMNPTSIMTEPMNNMKCESRNPVRKE